MPFLDNILQPTHLLVVLVIALLVLGPKRLPEVGRSLGRGLRDFRTALSGEDKDEAGLAPQAPELGSQLAAAAAQPAQTVQQPAQPVQTVQPAPPQTAEAVAMAQPAAPSH